MSIFRFFSTFCYYSLERRFFYLEYYKRHFPGLYCLIRKIGNMAIFEKNHRLTPLGKCQFFDFFNFFFHSLEKRFFVLEFRKRHFPNLYCQKKNTLKEWPFFDQNHGLTPLEKCQFSDCFQLVVFIAYKAVFSL